MMQSVWADAPAVLIDYVRLVVERLRRRVTLLAGVLLVGAGAFRLYWSDAVARTGSWSQNTFDAFGVGLVIGGVVDVSAVSLLNEAAVRNRYNREADDLIHEAGPFLSAPYLEPTTEFGDVYRRAVAMPRDRGRLLDRYARLDLQDVVRKGRTVFADSVPEAADPEDEGAS